MNLIINNNTTPIDDSVTNVASLVEFLYPDKTGSVAVAIDNKLVRRSDWAATPVHDNDELTVIAAAFGG